MRILLVAWLLFFPFWGLCFDYSLFCFFGKDVSFLIDILVGTVFCTLMVPLAVISLILQAVGVPVPFFPLTT